MKRAAITGWPVSHSLSPLMHGYWLKQYQVDGEYLRLPAQPEEFEAVIDRARRDGFTGVNVTVPHKEAAFRIASQHDKGARICRAVNLLVFEDGKILGRNTDHSGLHKSLTHALGGNPLAGKTVILLGAGGAARGGLLALSELGVSQIHILNRSPDRAERLAAELAPQLGAKLSPGPLDNWSRAAPQAALVVNTTSAGMSGHGKLNLDLDNLPDAAAVCDIVYNPLQTDLLKQAAAKGLKTIDGLGMLMHQAVPSFEAFFGVRPEVTPGLRAVLEQALA
jgi:shikimate dehydrogenase